MRRGGGGREDEEDEEEKSDAGKSLVDSPVIFFSFFVMEIIKNQKVDILDVQLYISLISLCV